MFIVAGRFTSTPDSCSMVTTSANARPISTLCTLTPARTVGAPAAVVS